ncbi:MAG: PAS domain S-box protein [Armatimonadetes bacterium]|nr:PAS domain S-box protein [Armatimonadota bacterium]
MSNPEPAGKQFTWVRFTAHITAAICASAVAVAIIADRMLRSHAMLADLVLVISCTLTGLGLFVVYSRILHESGAHRLRIDEALQRSEERYRNLFETSSDAIMTLEPPTWKFSSCNRATLEMFGAEDEARFIALGPWEVSPEFQPDGTPSSEKSSAMIQKAMEEGSAFFEWTHKRLNGEEFPTTVLLTRLQIGDKTMLQATVRDITRAKQAERELRESRDFLQTILDTAATAVMVVAPDKTITRINEAFVEMTGYPEEEVIGRSCQLLSGDPCCQWCSLFDDESTERVNHAECTIRTRDGRRLIIRKNAAKIRDENGEVTGAIESFVDVTELVAAREQALAATEAKSAFLARMSHEIRTPMNGVIGMLDLVMDTDLNAEQREMLEVADRSARALLGIINDVLDFSKIEAGELKLEETVFNPGEVVESAAEATAPLAAVQGIELACDIAPDVPELVRGDPTRVRQIVLNLINNAVKFTEEG